MKSEARDTSHPIHSPSLAATGPVPTGLWGTAIRSHPVARSGGRERLVKPTEGWSEELAAPRWGEVSTKRRRRGARGCGLESRIPGRGREVQTKESASQPQRRTSPRARLRATPPAPAPRDLPGNPLGSLTRTAGGRSPSGARGAPRGRWLRIPRGRGPAAGRGWGGEPRLFSAPSRLPALNGSVIDWPRVLFSPRVAGARGRLISIFPAAAPRCGSCCSRPPRRPPRIYLWFQEEVGAESGIRACRVKSTQKNFF